MQGYAGQMIGAATWSTLPSLSRITAPTLIVMGDDDPLVAPANGPLLAGRIADARLLVAPGEGHLLLMDPDSVVLEPIRQFLGARNLLSAPVWRDSDVPRKAPPRAPATRAAAATGALLRRVSGLGIAA